MSDSSSTRLPAILGGGVLAATAGVLFYTREHLVWDEWGPPLIVFGAAVAGGIGLATTMGRDEQEAGQVELAARREDLLARRAEALEALSALESQQSQMAPEDYDAERKSLLAMGAAAMRELDQLDSKAVASPPGAATPSTGVPVSAPSQGDPALAEALKMLTQSLGRGEIDQATYAAAVAALTAQQPAAPAPQAEAPPQSAPEPSPPAPAQPAAAASPPAQPAALAPQWTGAIYAVVGFGLIGTLLYFVSNDAQPRTEGAGMTGNQQLTSEERPPASAEPAFMAQAKANAEAALAADPENLEALNTLTQLNFQNPQQAFNYNQKARKIAPEDADALVYEAVITMIMGMPDKAQEKFDEVIAKHPMNEKAYAYKGLTLMEAQRYADAVAPLEKAIELGVTDHAIQNALAIAKAGGPPAQGAPPPPPAAAGGSAVLASGTVDIDPSRASFKAQTLFVNVKDPSRPGPPLAALKLPPGPFPMTFQVTEADRIAMGPTSNTPIPANFQLSLRLDDDGNAFSKAPTDPQVLVEGVAKGSTDLSLTLK